MSLNFVGIDGMLYRVENILGLMATTMTMVQAFTSDSIAPQANRIKTRVQHRFFRVPPDEESQFVRRNHGRVPPNAI